MNANSEHQNLPGGRDECKGDLESERGKAKTCRASLFPWVLYFSLTASLILVVTAFFQTQLMSLQEELAALKVNLSSECGCEEVRTKNLRKRSSDERGDEARQKLVTQAAHLRGSLPFQHIQKQGRIGPWSLSSSDKAFISLKGKSTEVEISETGIYYIYAQVYYLTSQSHNSYQILSYNGTEERKYHRTVATCSSHGGDSVGEVSCYTGLVTSFRRGQRLYLNQIEQDRVIHFTNGCSYFGIVLLRKNATLKGKKGSV